MSLQRKALAKPSKVVEQCLPIIEAIKGIYKNKMKPLEIMYDFPKFYSPCMNDIDFESLPIVMLMGQYSTGKTTFIKYLLERDFPGSRIGPEPTTDKFTAIIYDKKERVVPGNALAADMSRFVVFNLHPGLGFLAEQPSCLLDLSHPRLNLEWVFSIDSKDPFAPLLFFKRLVSAIYIVCQNIAEPQHLRLSR